jgi:hypothetical protein
MRSQDIWVNTSYGCLPCIRVVGIYFAEMKTAYMNLKKKTLRKLQRSEVASPRHHFVVRSKSSRIEGVDLYQTKNSRMQGVF